jgi:hypothetical protein
MKKLTLVVLVLTVVAMASCKSGQKCPAYSEVSTVEKGV